MQLTSKDKFLLVLLAFVALCAAYYFFLMVPKEEELLQIQDQIVEREMEKQAIEMKLASEPILDDRIMDLENSIVEKADAYYGDLTQEEMLMVVSRFAEGLPFEMPNLSFTDVLGNESDQIQYNAEVSFRGDYQSLLNYFRNVRSNDKKVVIRDVAIQSTDGEEVTGRYRLEFNAFPLVESYSEAVDRLVTRRTNFRDLAFGPFVHYEGFRTPQEIIEENNDFVSYPVFPEYPQDDEIIIDFEKYRPKTQIYGFEDGSNFFVANLPEIEGTLTRSMTRVAGGYSAHLRFDFGNPRPYSEANIVFDHEPVMINRQAEFLGVWVYAYEASNHNIGAVIVDAAGREYKVELTNGVNWTQWKEIEMKLPVEISYPCVIQRIYVEGVGYDQKLTGNYLFDQLQVSYPVQ